MGEDVREVTFTAKVENVSLEPVTPRKPRRTAKEIDNEIRTLKEERESNAMHEQNLETAKRIYDLYDSYIEAGFDEDQAWQLILTMVQTLKNN